MISPQILQTAWWVFKIIRKLYPIGREIFDKYQGTPVAKKVKPVKEIKEKANAEGFAIGNTEAELIRSAIHYVVDKKDRRKGLKKRKRS